MAADMGSCWLAQGVLPCAGADAAFVTGAARMAAQELHSVTVLIAFLYVAHDRAQAYVSPMACACRRRGLARLVLHTHAAALQNVGGGAAQLFRGPQRSLGAYSNGHGRRS